MFTEDHDFNQQLGHFQDKFIEVKEVEMFCGYFKKCTQRLTFGPLRSTIEHTFNKKDVFANKTADELEIEDLDNKLAF